jgi:dihydrodipicolinate synthase/N-acetylneuraminate lyase
MSLPQLKKEINEIIQKGVVIPAHPLALNKNRKLDERRQRALSRYYFNAGAGGIAVAVHTTQFEIRKPEVGLLQPVLKLAIEEANIFSEKTNQPVVKIAGVVGKTEQALNEAKLTSDLGYDAILLSLSAFKDSSNQQMIEHCKAVAEILPLIGFYLQPAVGGRKLDVDFWRSFSQIENVVAIKMAPFNRYQTLDVIRGVAESGRAEKIALYTGNDDNIVADLLTEFEIPVENKIIKKKIVGGLLGHWAVWTKKAVELLEEIHKGGNTERLLTKGVHVTDSNAAFFDAANDFAGCIVGLHEVLRRQGLLENILTLNPKEVLTAQQKAEIDRVYNSYPDLNDDEFVVENLDRWLS